MKRLTLLASVSAVALLFASPAPAAKIENYTPVTPERLKNPEPGNWLSIRRTYDGQSHSPLTQITPENVKGLKQAWTATTGPRQKVTEFAALPADIANQAPPIVNNGVMIVSAGDNQIIALDAKDGKEIWRYVYKLPEGLVPVHPTNRGVALWEDKIFFATLDAHLVALDAKTGTELWKTAVANWEEGLLLHACPARCERQGHDRRLRWRIGIRGFVDAYDANTGEHVWKTYTIPSPDQPGGDTWPGDTWQRGGGPIWITGNYDVKNNIAYWSTGNAAPWPGALRPGDNLYTSSLLGLDPDTGAIKNHFQYHYNDFWDWDETVPPTLIDLDNGDTKQEIALKFARNGHIYKLDRTGGKLSFIAGKPYVFSNVIKGLDARPAARSMIPTMFRSSTSESSSARQRGAGAIGRANPMTRRSAWCSFR